MKLKKYLIKNLKKCLIMSKKDTISKKRYHIKKKIPYQKKDTIPKKRYHIKKKIPYQKKTHQESKKSALSRNLKTNVKSTLSRIYTKYLKKMPYQGT